MKGLYESDLSDDCNILVLDYMLTIHDQLYLKCCLVSKKDNKPMEDVNKIEWYKVDNKKVEMWKKI